MDIEQEVFFDATPVEVYEALMDEEKHCEFTDSDCEISPYVGGKFSAYDGYIEGENIDLVEGSLIVQKWRASEWPKKHFSEVRFEIEEDGTGSKLIFTQNNVPDDFGDEIAQGWHEHYWDKMKETYGW